MSILVNEHTQPFASTNAAVPIQGASESTRYSPWIAKPADGLLGSARRNNNNSDKNSVMECSIESASKMGISFESGPVVHFKKRMLICDPADPFRAIECIFTLNDQGVNIGQRPRRETVFMQFTSSNGSGHNSPKSPAPAAMVSVSGPILLNGQPCTFIPFSDIVAIELPRRQGFAFDIAMTDATRLRIVSQDGLPSMEESVETLRALLRRFRSSSNQPSGNYSQQQKSEKSADVPIVLTDGGNTCLPVVTREQIQTQRTRRSSGSHSVDASRRH